jgi:hypothetical protein
VKQCGVLLFGELKERQTSPFADNIPESKDNFIHHVAFNIAYLQFYKLICIKAGLGYYISNIPMKSSLKISKIATCLCCTLWPKSTTKYSLCPI